jgi:hypothetical protein
VERPALEVADIYPDLAAQRTGAMHLPAFLAHADSCIDAKLGIIIDVEAIRQAEVNAARTMTDRTE